MNKYEVIYIIDTAMEEGARKELIQKFADLIAANGGAVEKVDEWGKRRLAYAIDYKVEGYYVLMQFTAGPDVPKELQRNLQINENVIRSQVVKLLQKKSSVKPRPVRAPFAAPAVEAPVAAPVQEAAPAAPAAEEAPAASQEAPAAAPAEA
ncbi:MAG TPA: 30S ribosomal protein S6 [Candidatus Onthenecus intestinigallinarum]|uniref:Small ribosomal subunit protein bS6 n=1 Tax=Candidatus Onthenecus intestinigallinarum TaxID=2840875 RepID=A0A9D0ZAP0_9FIRM|nr:30S ribosomal protein S6 [Candidatus Onthenecus intestinigallinarum]